VEILLAKVRAMAVTPSMPNIVWIWTVRKRERFPTVPFGQSRVEPWDPNDSLVEPMNAVFV
jgi:hypothetical protein